MVLSTIKLMYTGKFLLANNFHNLLVETFRGGKLCANSECNITGFIITKLFTWNILRNS